MTDKLIFISCGQQTSEEKQLGTSIKNLIDSIPGYKAYFAEYVQNLDALATNVFDGLRKCSGVISILHERGLVLNEDKTEWGYRSSVWINQEIAVLAYRKHFEGVDIPILVFKDEKIRLEGAMTSLIINPKPISTESDILETIKKWLKSSELSLNSLASDELFYSKWQKLSDNSIKVLSALIDEGGIQTKETAVKICLRDNYKFSKNDASNSIRNAKPEFIKTDLVKLISNLHSGDELSINPIWKWHIIREVNKIKGIKQLNRKGVIFSSSEEKNAVQVSARDISDLFGSNDSRFLIEVENYIKEDLSKNSFNSDQEQIDYLIRHLALSQIYQAFEQCYASIFGSQIFLLKKLNEALGNGRDNNFVKAHFLHVQELFKPSFNEWSYDSYMRYLFENQLITQKDNILHISVKGIGFLVWLTKAGRDENKLL